MNVILFFNWLWIGELLTFKTGPPCINNKSTYIEERFFFAINIEQFRKCLQNAQDVELEI